MHKHYLERSSLELKFFVLGRSPADTLEGDNADVNSSRLGVTSRYYLSSVHKNKVFVEYRRNAVPPVAATMFKNDVTPPMLVRSGGQATGLTVVPCCSGFGDAIWRHTYAVTVLFELFVSVLQRRCPSAKSSDHFGDL